MNKTIFLPLVMVLASTAPILSMQQVVPAAGDVKEKAADIEGRFAKAKKDFAETTERRKAREAQGRLNSFERYEYILTADAALICDGHDTLEKFAAKIAEQEEAERKRASAEPVAAAAAASSRGDAKRCTDATEDYAALMQKGKERVARDKDSTKQVVIYRDILPHVAHEGTVVAIVTSNEEALRKRQDDLLDLDDQIKDCQRKIDELPALQSKKRMSIGLNALLVAAGLYCIKHSHILGIPRGLSIILTGKTALQLMQLLFSGSSDTVATLTEKMEDYQQEKENLQKKSFEPGEMESKKEIMNRRRVRHEPPIMPLFSAGTPVAVASFMPAASAAAVAQSSPEVQG